MGCTHSTPIPSRGEFANAAHTNGKQTKFLLEHSESPSETINSLTTIGIDHLRDMNGEQVWKESGNDSDEKGEMYGFMICESDIRCVIVDLEKKNKWNNHWVVGPLQVQFGKHFPGYSMHLKDLNSNKIVAHMLPLYRPGRPTIKIYTPTPAFEGQNPSKSQSKKLYGDIYAWAEWRMRGGWTYTSTHFTIEMETALGKVAAFTIRRAGAIFNPWTKLVVTNADTGEPAALLHHLDELCWRVYVSPKGIDPVLMICTALMTEQLAISQRNANKIRNNPKLVFQM